MWNLIRHELYLNRKSFLIWFIIIAATMAWMASMTPMILDSSDELAGLLESYPKGLMDAFNTDIHAFSSFEGWTASEPYIIMVLLVACFAAAMTGTAIAREIDQRTGEFLFSFPNNRRQIYYAKTIAQLVQIALVYWGGVAFTFVAGSMVADIVNASGLMLVFTAGFLVVLAAAGFGYAITSLINNERTALSLGIGFVLVSFLLNGLAGFSDSLRWLTKLSIFSAFNTTNIMNNHNLPAITVLILAVLYLGGTALGGELLVKKNLNV